MAINSHSDDERIAALDARVRGALEAPPHVVSRVVATALRPETGTRRRVLGLPPRALAAAASVLVAGVVLAALLWPWTNAPLSGPRGMMTNEGEIIVIKMADRPITLIAPNAMTSPVPPGTMSIVLLGESQ